jgi:hypothetical protein
MPHRGPFLARILRDVAVAKVLPVAILDAGLAAIMPTIGNPHLRARGDHMQ